MHSVMESTAGRHAVCQLLLHRYMKLIERVKTLYAITPEQEAALVENIVNIDWISSHEDDDI
jgi:hypothetical protein